MTVIKLKNGEAKIKEYVDRKTHREWRVALNENRTEKKVEVEDKDGKIKEQTKLIWDAESEEKSNDILVLGMLESLTIDGVAQEINQTSLDRLDRKDYETISSNCFKTLLSKEEEKKKS